MTWRGFGALLGSGGALLILMAVVNVVLLGTPWR